MVAKKDNGELLGTVSRNKIAENDSRLDLVLASLMTPSIYAVYADNSLQLAVEFMLKTGQDILPVMDRQSKAIVGIVAENDVLKVFEQRFREEKAYA
jgi:CBS-domain-containing membrane protein